MLTKAYVSRVAVVATIAVAFWGSTLGEGVYAHKSERSRVGSGAGQALQQRADPELSIGDASVREDDEEATLTVSQGSVADHDVSVEYTTIDGSAVSPGDYTSASGVATIPAGSTSTSILLLIIDDDEQEDVETLTVRLANPVGGTIREDGESGTVTIVDADPGANLGYLFAVYTVTWGAFFVYVFLTSRRHRAMRQEIEALRSTLAGSESRADDE